MAATTIPVVTEARNIHSASDHCDRPKSIVLIDKVDEALAKPATLGQVWERGCHLPEELGLTDKQRGQLRDVDVGALVPEIAVALAAKAGNL